MDDRERYLRNNKLVADFIEEYKKYEHDYVGYERAFKRKVRAERKARRDKVTYKRITFKYQGRLRTIRFVDTFTEGKK